MDASRVLFADSHSVFEFFTTGQGFDLITEKGHFGLLLRRHRYETTVFKFTIFCFLKTL